MILGNPLKFGHIGKVGPETRDFRWDPRPETRTHHMGETPIS